MVVDPQDGTGTPAPAPDPAQDPARSRGAVKVALTGWFSFRDGEITAGDLLALESVCRALDAMGLEHDSFWSPVFRPEGPSLSSLPTSASYTHMIFVCGPLHGEPVERLHRMFAASTRIAVGVSVIDPSSPAVSGFARVVARDGPGRGVTADLSVLAPLSPPLPVAGVILTEGQGEYGPRRRHDQVVAAVRRRLQGKDAALVPLGTRLSSTEWNLASTPAGFEAALCRMDVVVTNRLHGLVLALRCGVPALAVDPVAGGAKVSAQARAFDWPAVMTCEDVDSGAFDRWWTWCLGEGRDLARLRQRQPPHTADDALRTALSVIRPEPPE
jgi:hypothetical protein